MKRSIIVFTLITIFVCSNQVFAGPQTKAGKKDIQSDLRALSDDRRDVDHLSDLVMMWDQARKNDNEARLQQLEDQIAVALRRDVAELQKEEKAAKTEVDRAVAEENRSKRQVVRERRDLDGDRHALRTERRQLKDDSADAIDDMWDAKAVSKMLEQKRELANELITLQQNIDQAGLRMDKVLRKKQAQLLEEYLELSQKEIQMGVRELKEDKHEFKEDNRNRF